MAKYTWEVEWCDGSVTAVVTARGHHHALRSAMQTAHRVDYKAIRRRSTSEPFIYSLVSWRAKGNK